MTETVGEARERLIVLRRRMELEMAGIKFRRSAFTIARNSFKLTGNRKEVYQAFCKLVPP